MLQVTTHPPKPVEFRVKLRLANVHLKSQKDQKDRHIVPSSHKLHDYELARINSTAINRLVLYADVFQRTFHSSHC